MEEKAVEPQKLTLINTKKEMLDAYNNLLRQMQEKSQTQVQPERKIEEKKKKEALDVADSLSTEGVVKEINNLKLEIGKMLIQLSDRLADEVNKYQMIQKAIQVKDTELQEIYEIARSAETLAALIESQHQKRREFDSQLELKKEVLEEEINAIRAEWEKEKKLHEKQAKEQEEAEKKRREREKEEYEYALKREKLLTKDKFEDEKAKLGKEIQLKKEQMERELDAREKAVAGKEEEWNKLQAQVGGFQKEMDAAVKKVAQETSEKLKLEAKNREDLLKKENEGERNVLTTRIESLEKTVKEQAGQIAKLSQNLETAYQKVQDIALKAVEGSSSYKSLASLQQFMAEQVGKKPQEK